MSAPPVGGLRSQLRLSERARRSGAAYAGPGSAIDGPRLDRPPIAFTVGLPDPDLLPGDALAQAASAVLKDEGASALSYGGAQGYEPLRDWLAEHWTDIDGCDLSAANFCMANGSAGALVNVCETFLDAGDVAGVESASFPGSIRAIRAVTPNVEVVPVDDDGLDVDALEAQLDQLAARGARMRLLYTIPNFHNPTGSTLTVERRGRLVELCRRHGVLIVEDDAYGELWFGHRPPPSLFTLAEGEGVVKIATFSKIVAPGLRAGWSQASPDIVNALVATRYEMGGSPLVFRMLHRLASSGFVDGHIAAGRALYAARARSLVAGLSEHCQGHAAWNVPDGGFFVWLTLHDTIDPAAFSDAARDEGVSYVNGRVFFADQHATDGPRLPWGASGDSRHLRLAFSAVAEADITEGTSRLGRALDLAARD